MTNLLDLDETKEVVTESGTGNSISPARINTGISVWFTKETGTPNYFCFITDLSKALPVRTHKFTSDGNVPCFKSPVLGGDSNTDCKYCKEPSSIDKTKTNSSRNSLIVLGYFFDSVGKTYDIMDPKDSTKVLRKVDANPIKALEILRGKEDINLETIKTLHTEGVLLSELFQVTRHPKEAKKAALPELASRAAIKSKFKHLKEGLVVPMDVQEKYDGMGVEQVRGLLLNCYVSGKYTLDWDMLTKFVVKPESVKKEDTPTNEIE